MHPYEQLLQHATSCGLIVIEKQFRSNAKGLIKGNRIGIRKDMPISEKLCALTEEFFHFRFTTGNILDQSNIVSRKQEILARQWAYKCLLPLEEIVQAFYAKVSNRYELADFLGITEEFLQEGIDRYTEKFGLSVRVDDEHVIYFEPLHVKIERRY